MSERKTGLHKEVSTIFNGVPVPKDDGTAQSPGVPSPEQPDYGSSSPATTITAKPQQPKQPQSKAVPAKEPKAYVAKKSTAQVRWRQTWQQIQNKLFAPKPGVSATKQKVMAVLVPVLFIVLIFVFVQVFGTASHKPGSRRKLGPIKAVATSVDEIDWQIPDVWPGTLRNPMQFGSVTTIAAESGGPLVKGIVYSKDNPTAIVGTQIVHQGDKVSGTTIVKINEDSVELERNGKKWTQKVQP